MSCELIELTIDDKARSYARIHASLIPDEYQRKRANAAIIRSVEPIGFSGWLLCIFDHFCCISMWPRFMCQGLGLPMTPGLGQ